MAPFPARAAPAENAAVARAPRAPIGEEQQLIERIRAGDRAAFAEVFTAHHAALCDFAVSYVRSSAHAEELVQTLFLRIWERRTEWNVRHGVRAYLFGALRHAALNCARHERLEHMLPLRLAPDDMPGMGARPRAPDAAVHVGDLERAVHGAVAALPERCRAVLELRWREGMSYAEIAAVLGITPKTVENHLARALNMLRPRLGSYYP